jgi:hypothetical protein
LTANWIFIIPRTGELGLWRGRLAASDREWRAMILYGGNTRRRVALWIAGGFDVLEDAADIEAFAVGDRIQMYSKASSRNWSTSTGASGLTVAPRAKNSSRSSSL